jgi:hypothetical protein
LHDVGCSLIIILPFSDNKDEDSINNFLKVMATNDTRIRKSYMSKKLGGYIDLVHGEEDMALPFREKLLQKGFKNVQFPASGEIINI